MYSDNQGHSWHSTHGTKIATLGPKPATQNDENQEQKATTVLPSTADITVYDIPTHSGILNQESQTADPDGGFHVLNRENTHGEEKWLHYHRSPSGIWRRTPIRAPSRPTETGSRGSLCTDRRGNLYAILPGNVDSTLSILKSQRDEGRDGDEMCRYGDFEMLWSAEGYDGEPLVDVQGLEESDVLSVFTRTSKKDGRAGEVVVLDFDLGGEMRLV
jgi:hypothetical protein